MIEENWRLFLLIPKLSLQLRNEYLQQNPGDSEDWMVMILCNIAQHDFP